MCSSDLHFRAVDAVIDHAGEPLTENMIKCLHRVLKTATGDAAKEWFTVGDYKRIPNEVSGMPTTAPEDVAEEIEALLTGYEPERPHTLEEIVDMHVRFERIHPFQDGNGRVGRLIMTAARCTGRHLSCCIEGGCAGSR